MKINVPIVGFIIALILPIIGIFIVYLIKFSSSSLDTFIRVLTHNTDTAATVLSLAVLANLAPFIIFINKRMDQAAKGVFVATMLYGVLMVLLKFVW